MRNPPTLRPNDNTVIRPARHLEAGDVVYRQGVAYTVAAVSEVTALQVSLQHGPILIPMRYREDFEIDDWAPFDRLCYPDDEFIMLADDVDP